MAGFKSSLLSLLKKPFCIHFPKVRLTKKYTYILRVIIVQVSSKFQQKLFFSFGVATSRDIPFVYCVNEQRIMMFVLGRFNSASERENSVQQNLDDTSTAITSDFTVKIDST